MWVWVGLQHSICRDIYDEVDSARSQLTSKAFIQFKTWNEFPQMMIMFSF